MHPIDRKPGGFTLVEVIVVITIIGILFGMIAMFIRVPMSGAVAQARRAALADAASTPIQRLRREIRQALPNSVRVLTSGTSTFIEFLPTIGGGRYCSEPPVGGSCSTASGSGSNALTFEAADSSFEVIGPLVTGLNANTSSSELVVYNLGIPGADAYSGDNVAAVTSISSGSVTTINFSSRQFPFASPGNRFHLIGGPVSYVCTSGLSNGSGTGTLRRYSGYARQSAQRTDFTGLAEALLAEHVADCRIDYAQAVINRDGLLSIRLVLRQEDEIVSLTHAIQIPNTP